VNLQSVSTDEYEGAQQNTATFIMYGEKPVVGAQVIIYNFTHQHRMFGGTVISARQASTIGKPQKAPWHVVCVDWTYLLNRQRVWKKYSNMTPDAIIIDLVSEFSEGFTVDDVQTGAPVIFEAEFSGSLLHEAITRVTNRIGWHWYMDRNRGVHLHPGEEHFARSLTPHRYHWWNLQYEESASQVRNRIWGEGGGANTTEFVAAGASYIPVEGTGWYTGAEKMLSVGGMKLQWTSINTSLKRINIDTVNTPILYNISEGVPVNVLVMREDLESQAKVRELEQEGDGVHEYVVTDHRLGVEAILSKIEAELRKFKDPVGSGSYISYDQSARAGWLIDINLPARDINIRAVINHVSIKARAPRRYFERTVEFTTAHSLGFYEMIKHPTYKDKEL
jgi:hypothetical protein